MLHFTSGVNDVELSLELAGTAMNVATGHYYDLYGEAFEQQVGICVTCPVGAACKSSSIHVSR
jgi:hypothetical protein